MRDTAVSGMEDVSHPRLLPGALKGGRQLMSVAVISSTGHVYRQQKVSAGRRTIRKQRYPIQPHDIVIYKGRKYETSGCHNNGTRAILLPDKKSVAIKKLTVYCFSGGYVIQPLNERGEAGGM